MPCVTKIERHAYAHAHNDGWHSHSRAVAEQQQPSSSSNSDHNLGHLGSRCEGMKLSPKLIEKRKPIHQVAHAKVSSPSDNLKSRMAHGDNGG